MADHDDYKIYFNEFETGYIKDVKPLNTIETKYMADVLIDVGKDDDKDWFRKILGFFDTLEEAKSYVKSYKPGDGLYVADVDYNEVNIRQIEATEMCFTLIPTV